MDRISVTYSKILSVSINYNNRATAIIPSNNTNNAKFNAISQLASAITKEFVNP